MRTRRYTCSIVRFILGTVSSHVPQKKQRTQGPPGVGQVRDEELREEGERGDEAFRLAPEDEGVTEGSEGEAMDAAMPAAGCTGSGVEDAAAREGQGIQGGATGHEDDAGSVMSAVSQGDAFLGSHMRQVDEDGIDLLGHEPAEVSEARVRSDTLRGVEQLERAQTTE